MIHLRDYQAAVDDGINRAWADGAKNVCAVIPTGGGKTVNMSYKFKQHIDNRWGMTAGIAHRQELVSQMSLNLARSGVRHRLMASDDTVRNCVRIHNDEVGRSFYDSNALCVIAGVDTLVRRKEAWFGQVTLWQTDETHHLLENNKWGTTVDLFPNARGIGWTATPRRADGKGLGRWADGVMDAMVEGPTMRELIARGFLTGYRLIARPSDLKVEDITVTASGDYSPKALSDAAKESHIVGDIVAQYLKHARGKLGLTFCVDVEEATKTAAAFRAAGVAAEVVTGETPDTLRFAIMRRFSRREIMQIVSVDILGEGVDVPAVEVVSLGRPTQSLSVYLQQIGRALRLMLDGVPAHISAPDAWAALSDGERLRWIAASGKPVALILDHVSNWERHGAPDGPRPWTLDARERGVRGTPGPNSLRVCTACSLTFERYLVRCKWCGEPIPPPAGRGAPEFVDGDLVELDPAILRALQGEINRQNAPMGAPPGMSGTAVAKLHHNHVVRQQSHARLVTQIQLWAGGQRDRGLLDREIHRLFWLTFNTDVMTAQTLPAADSDELTATIAGANAKLGLVSAGVH